jgi:hypothetical protein
MRVLVVAIVLAGSVARADGTLDAGLALVDEMKQDSDGSQLGDHLIALKAHAAELAKLHKDHKKDKALSAKLDTAEKAVKDALALGAAAKKVVKKKAFAAADKKLQAKLAAYATAATAANELLAAAPAPVPIVSPSSIVPGAARVTSTTCKKIEFLPDGSGGKLVIRAVLVDARRKQSRELAANNGPVAKADDYELAYTVHDRKADWKVVDESYVWTVASAPAPKSSREVVKNDVIEVPSGSVTGKIAGTIAWKNGATEETDKEDCAFEITGAK